MAIGLFANTKVALAFAGSVLVGSALLVSAMGSQFTPHSQSDDEMDGYSNDYSGDGEYTGSQGEMPDTGAETYSSYEGQGSEGFASDDELMDDTSGFNPGGESQDDASADEVVPSEDPDIEPPESA